MLYDLRMTSAQVYALSEWVWGDTDTPVYLRQAAEDNPEVEVAQGDARAVIAPDGSIREETP
jgi:hypothetical protein